MTNPSCIKKSRLTGNICNGFLKRQHSGRRRLWVCRKNKNHTYLVGSVFDSIERLKK